MTFSISLKASLAFIGSAAAVQYLAPAQDINLPASETAKEPLKWLGANSPWFAGMIIAFVLICHFLTFT